MNTINGKTNVLFIVPSLCRAGAEMQLINLINRLNRNKYNKNLFSYLENLEQLDRLDRRSVNYYHSLRRGKFDYSFIKELVKIIDDRDIDIIHCTLQHSLLVGSIARLLSKKKPKLIAAIHKTISESFVGEMSDRILYKRLFKKCSGVIFVCEAQKRYWEEKYPSLSNISCVIYNGVDTSYFDPKQVLKGKFEIRNHYSIPENAFVSSCIANFRPEKAHEHLIDAFSKTDDSMYLLLVGDGPRRDILKKQVEDNKLKHRVFFLGTLNDVRPVLSASDVTLLTSTSVETFSMAMLESLSMGVPMIAPDIGGLREAIIQKKSGFLFPVAKWDRLADILLKLNKNKEELTIMRENCRKLIIQKFSEEKMIEKTDQLFSKFN
jgi:glycosyltransferase involved in cell wall biosynthesis